MSAIQASFPFKANVQSPTPIEYCLQLDGVVHKTSEKAEALLRELQHSDEAMSDISSKDSCLRGFIGGTLVSLVTKNPFPLFFGLSACLSRVGAQQKVGKEFQVNNYTNDWQRFPSVATFNNDNFVVIWQSNGQDGDGNGVYGQVFDSNESKIGSEFRANTFTIHEQQYPTVTRLSNGNFVVVWGSYGQDGPTFGVYGQVFYGNVTKIGSEFQVNNYTTDSQKGPAVANFSNGNFVVTWASRDQDGSGDGVYGQLFDGNGRKIGSEFQVNSYTTGGQNDPSVASFSNGNFVVIWHSESQDGDGDGIYGQLFDGNDSKIGSEFQVNTYTANNQFYPSVESFSNGNFVVTWTSRDQDGSDSGVYGQLFDGNGRKIGNEFQINTYTYNWQGSSSVATFSNGNFVVTWESSFQEHPIPHFGVYGQLFSGNGSRIGIEFRANTYTTGSQGKPSVASFSNGNFIITWESEKQDGDFRGIFGQIFRNNVIFPSSTTIRSTFPVTSESTNQLSSTSPNRNNNLFWLGF